MSRTLRNEFAATFGLVLLGTGACVIEANSGRLGSAGVGLVFGLAVFAMIKLFSAQMNPAATLALCLTGDLGWREGAQNIMAQAAGAVGASVLLRTFAGAGGGTLGATLPHAGPQTAFVAEALMTFALLFAALRSPAAAVPVVAGLIVALEATFGGALSGASMNPARSLGPALVSGVSEGLWIYLLAPSLGAAAAAGLHSRATKPVRPDAIA